MCSFGWIVRTQPLGPAAVSASARPGEKVRWRCAPFRSGRWPCSPAGAVLSCANLPRAGEWRLRAGLEEISLDGALAVAAAELADFHADPADRFIAATAMAHAATLITADQAMLRWPGPLLCHPAGT